MQFPYIERYAVILAERDQGIALVIMLAVMAILVLCQARYWYPRFLKPVQVTGVALFWGSLTFMLALKVLAR